MHTPCVDSHWQCKHRARQLHIKLYIREYGQAVPRCLQSEADRAENQSSVTNRGPPSSCYLLTTHSLSAGLLRWAVSTMHQHCMCTVYKGSAPHAGADLHFIFSPSSILFTLFCFSFSHSFTIGIVSWLL